MGCVNGVFFPRILTVSFAQNVDMAICRAEHAEPLHLTVFAECRQGYPLCRAHRALASCTCFHLKQFCTYPERLTMAYNSMLNSPIPRFSIHETRRNCMGKAMR